MKQQLIEWLIDEVAPRVRQNGNAHGELLKFAHQKNFSPALVESMGQLFNTAKTLSYMEKSANRGGSFPLVDVPKLVEDYLKIEQPKSASQEAVNEWFPAKDATTERPGMFPNLFVEAETGVKIAHETVVPALAVSVRETIRQNESLPRLIEHLGQQEFDLGEDNRTIFHKWAKILRQNPRLSFADLEADAWQACGDNAKPLLDCMAHYMDQTKRASSAGPERLVDDRNGFVADVEKLLINLQQLTEVRGKKAAAKAAAVGTAAGKGKGKGSQWQTGGPGAQPRGNRPPKPGKGEEEAAPDKAEADPMTSPFKSPFFTASEKSPFKSIPDQGFAYLKPLKNFLFSQGTGMMGDRANDNQRTVDHAMADTRSQAVLQNLLMTDEVLSEADPEQVAGLYQTIRETSPELAGDINVMRVALHAAIQHTGLDPFATKGFADAEKSRQDVSENIRKREKAEYSIKGPQPKADKGGDKKEE